MSSLWQQMMGGELLCRVSQKDCFIRMTSFLHFMKYSTSSGGMSWPERRIKRTIISWHQRRIGEERDRYVDPRHVRSWQMKKWRGQILVFSPSLHARFTYRRVGGVDRHRMDESTCTSLGSGLGALALVRQATKPSGRTSTAPSDDTPIFVCQPFSRSSRSASGPIR